MGIYDREYYREDEPRGGVLNSSWSIVAQLIVVNVVLYFADMLLAQDHIHWLTRNMAVTPDTVSSPLYWWQFLTYGFAHNPNHLWHIVGNMLTLGMFGRHVEPIYGRKEFLRFYLFTLLLCSVVWGLKERLFFPLHPHSLIGASGAVTAVFMLFVFHYPHEKVLLGFVIPVPVWLVGLIVIVTNLSLSQCLRCRKRLRLRLVLSIFVSLFIVVIVLVVVLGVQILVFVEIEVFFVIRIESEIVLDRLLG